MPKVAFETLSDLFYNLCDRYRAKNKVAFAFKPTSTTPYQPIYWDQVETDVYALATYLIGKGITKGDRIAILSENRYEWAVVDMASQILGAINVSLYTAYPASQVEYIVGDSGAKFLFTSTGIQLKKALDIFEGQEQLQEIITFTEPNRKEYLDPDYVHLFSDILSASVANIDVVKKKIHKLSNTITPEDICTFIYTSGTTGKPKGAMLTHRNIVSNIKATLEHIVDIHKIDRTLSFLPLCHSFERTTDYYLMMAIGAQIYYAESVDTVSKNLTEAKPAILISVPRLFEKIYSAIKNKVESGSDAQKKVFQWAVDVGYKYYQGKRGFVSVQKKIADKLVFDQLKQRTGGRIDFFVSGGAALPPEIAKFFLSAGFNILEGYGLTETSPVICANTKNDEMIGTVGKVLPGVMVAIQELETNKIIAKLTGEDYPTNLSSEAGEILVKGPNVMKGYWNLEEETKEMIDDEGWLHTGDVGRFVEGKLKITDRIKHMIVNAGGKNIYPGPIEDDLKTQSKWIDQVVIVGEAQQYMACLIVPDFDNLKLWARENDISYSSDEDIIQHEEVIALFNKDIRSFSRGLASHEKIRDFRLLSEALTVENGLLTPTLKVKRKVVTQTYKKLIDSIFAEK